MKKVLCSLLVIMTIVMSLNINVFAAESDKFDENQIITNPDFQEPVMIPQTRSSKGGALLNGVPANDPGPSDYYSEENQAKIAERTKLRQQNEKMRTIRGSNQLNLRSVPTQAKTNWCGPASAYTVLMYYNRQTPTQAALAREMGIYSSGGAETYDMENALSSRGVPVNTWNVDQGNLEFDLQNTVDKKVPMIAQLNTKHLARYNGLGFGHYVTVYGYASNYMYYADNHYNASYRGKYRDTISNLSKALYANSGWYISN